MKFILNTLLVYSVFLPLGHAMGNYPSISQQSLRVEEGRTLQLYHYLPDETPVDSILLLPGLGTTHRVYDLDRHYSLARYLQGKGMEVWVADSNPPTFEKWVEWDIPKALEVMGPHRHLAILGLDVGGLAAMAYVSNHPETSVDRVVALGTTVYLRYPSQVMQRLLKASESMKESAIDPRLGAQTRVPFSVNDETYFDILVWDPSVLPEIRDEFLTAGLKPIPRTFVAEIQQWYKKGEVPAVAGSLSTWNLPILLIGGKLDPLAHPAMIRETYRGIHSPNKVYRLFSLGYRDRLDYSHEGLLLSRNASREVYPYIEKWLRDHR